MANKHVFRSVLLAAIALPVAAWASQPATTPAAAQESDVAPAAEASTLLERKFQQAARHYKKYQHEGQVVYCKKEKAVTSSIPYMRCLSETQLRAEVASHERWRNPVQRPFIGTVSSIG